MQTGAGRTGQLYAYQHYNVVRIFSPARKGWAAASQLARCWQRHGRRCSSRVLTRLSARQPLAATVANSVLAQIDSALLAGVGERHIVDKLNALNAKYDVFSAVREWGC